jgi:hypothetical protein
MFACFKVLLMFTPDCLCPMWLHLSIETGTAAPQPGMAACEITFPFRYYYASVAVLYVIMAALVALKARAFAKVFLTQTSAFRHRHATSRGYDTARLALGSLLLAVVAFATRGIWSIVLASVEDPTAMHCATFFLVCSSISVSAITSFACLARPLQ